MSERSSTAGVPAQSAQEFMRSLREAFNARATGLEAEAIRVLQEGPTVGMAHVVFPFHTLLVTAIFNGKEQRFTQLIARDASGSGMERPSYTISLFL